MKKTVLLLLAALMVFTACAMTGCGDKTTDTTSSNASSSASESKTASSAGTDSKAEVSSEETSAEAASSAATSSEETSSVVNANASPLWLTHYNMNTAEGAGVVFTETDTASGYWHHIAFKPVDAENGVYEITEISFGATDGQGKALTVPEGGFVYAINIGNDYPSLAEQNPNEPAFQNKPNYTSAACNDCVKAVDSWAVGMVIQFTGLDLETLEVPTETPDKQWYEDGYVCTATWVEISG